MPKTGGLSPLPRESCSPESEACLCSIFFFFNFAQFQRGNSQLAHLRGNSRPRTLDLARDVMQLHVYFVPSWTAPSGRVSLPPAGSRTTRAAMTSPCAFQKANLAVRGVPHASTCALPVRASQTRSRGEPVQSESSYPA